MSTPKYPPTAKLTARQWTIKPDHTSFVVRDPEQRFRGRFPTQAAAQQYVDAHAKGRRSQAQPQPAAEPVPAAVPQPALFAVEEAQ